MTEVPNGINEVCTNAETNLYLTLGPLQEKKIKTAKKKKAIADY